MEVLRLHSETPFVIPFKRASPVMGGFGEEQAVEQENHRAAGDAVDAHMEGTFQVPFVIFPGIGDVIILGQMTLICKF